ncbi:MAG: hypothetical protein R3B45_09195 [Bdellovibrionota bacterium]
MQSNPAFALWEKAPISIYLPTNNRSNIHWHSIRALQSINKMPYQSPAFNLINTQTTSFKKGIEYFIHKQIKNPFIGLNIKSVTNPKILSLTKFRNTPVSHETIELEFKVKNIPICGFQIKAHHLMSGNQVIMGNFPQVETDEPPPESDWPRLNESYETILDNLYRQGLKTEKAKITKKEKCYSIIEENLVPTWQIWLTVNSIPFRAIADTYEVIDIQMLAFDVKGTATVYDTNPKNGQLKSYEIELSGDSYLTNEFFTTDTATIPRAKSDTNEFNYDVDDKKFQETSAFVHAALMFEYFRSLGYEWHGNKPMDLRIHAIPGSSENNAQYLPSDGTPESHPAIAIGDGDGVILQNLSVDSDVIAHEFSHHVIFKTLTETRGESLVLHEGLADFFANSRTGDDCLGESICPANSDACWSKGECLRSAANEITYKGTTYNSIEAHQKGQLISGYLRDLREKGGVPAENVTSTVFASLDLLVKNSEIKDFILSLFITEQEKFSGQYCQTMYDIAVDRGFSTLLENINCAVDYGSWSLPTETETTPKKKSSNNGGGLFSSCGAIQNSTQTTINLMLLAILLCLPLCLSILAIFKNLYINTNS